MRPRLSYWRRPRMELITYSTIPVEVRGFPGPRIRNSTPRTKTCPFTPANKDLLPGTPNPWGPRTWGTHSYGLILCDLRHPPIIPVQHKMTNNVCNCELPAHIEEIGRASCRERV